MSTNYWPSESWSTSEASLTCTISTSRLLAYLFSDARGGFAGLCGFCSWVPLKAMEELQVASAAEGLRSIPVLLEHCRDDEVITVGNGQHLQGWLQSLGFGVQWHEYADGGHWVNEPQGVDDLVGFLRAIMARLPGDGEKE